ncbi:MAG: phosphate ABC transporter permease subunit PstC [Paracoccaceae bacterium]
MSTLLLLGVVLVLSVMAFVLCRSRALASAGGDMRRLHSLPAAYGWHGALMVGLPALAVLALWLVLQPVVIARSVGAVLPPVAVQTEAETESAANAEELALIDVRRVAAGIDAAVSSGQLPELVDNGVGADLSVVQAALSASGVALGSDLTPETLAAAQKYRSLAATGLTARTIFTLIAALLGLAAAVFLTNKDFRARNRVENVVMGLLIAASSVAILTTVGIIYSMLSEAVNFFSFYPVADFFFGLTWSPNFRGNSEFGLIPLVWGTLYITLISMLVAVPLGLFSAIYLAEYASARTRNVVKPLIEVIAGIPTVVFGLFALVTVGPFLRDWIAQPLGLGDSGSSVMTAGIVIGILNIPFVSSLSDDIINAVPQSMRDGSYGLGATKSETIRQVVLPAALPGIVGAILMAGSRAIGETMIVSMGAGAAAKLDLNPFEAMTTMTVKIVGQLTGDTDFASPETLVAFALGMTLFIITLGLNVLALYVVRKYREQYE